MALNDYYNISELPTIDVPRSKFEKSHKHLTTFNVGELVPVFIDELLPGTTVNIRTNMLTRLQTLITPIFDNLMQDTYFFFVPNRLVFEHFEELMGEDKTGHWYPNVDYKLPTVLTRNGFKVGSVADHFGIPVNVKSTEVNALPFRMYALIWNEYFRDENLSDPVLIDKGDGRIEIEDLDDGNYINNGSLGTTLLKVAKYKDLFTTALPSPQKGPSVILESFLQNKFPKYGDNNVPVVALNENHLTYWPDGQTYPTPLKFDSGTTQFRSPVVTPFGELSSVNSELTSVLPYGGLAPSNLWANFDDHTFGVSINQLRLALATQRLLERDARYGTRYTEVITGHFGITSPDSRLQRPEFIGGNHTVLNVDQVAQTSQTDQTPLGDLGAYSVTADSNDDVVAFTALEHGFIIGLSCVRYEHSYQQGLDRMWSRESRLDYYWPEFSNLGEVGIKEKEIFLEDYSSSLQPEEIDEIIDNRDRVFGYQEFGYDYRYKRNYITGEFHSGHENTLEFWHLADNYNSAPVLGHEWILEDGDIVDRVIAVSQRVSNQVMSDFYFEYDYVAPLPIYSIPGIIDMR